MKLFVIPIYGITLKDYLISQGQINHTIRNKLQYAKRFYHVLNQENAKDVLNVSIETRQHAMKSLVSLSKTFGNI